MLVYLDTSVYCRPFDDQTQQRIIEEADAFEGIIDRAKAGAVTLLLSDILVYEVSNILTPQKRVEVEKYLTLCKTRIEENEAVKDLAIIIRDRCGIKDRDALHIASAILGKADYFLTCDDDVIKKEEMGCVKHLGSGIIILNPKDFIEKENFNDKD
jgi:predicted nucleic acid-binding protein